MATYFQPLDEREHKKGNAGQDVPDYCRVCRQPFMDHSNGECPEGISPAQAHPATGKEVLGR